MAFTLLSLATVLFLSLCSGSPVLVHDVPEIYPFDFFSRYDWGAEESTDKRPLDLPASYVVIHHTYLPAACHTFKQCAADMRSMQTVHKSLGWGDIGYNFCVGSEGGAYEGRGWDKVGIHAGNANNISVGICVIGDWRTQLPPKIQLKTIKDLIRAGVLLGKIREDYKLIGHKQVTATECPGNALLSEISTWNNYVHGWQNVG